MAGAFRRWNARRRSPSMRALREAGPPLRWIVAAIPLALAVVIVLYVAGVENRAVLVAIPFVAFVLVCFIDRDGWRIRMAMAEVAGASASGGDGAGSRSTRCPPMPGSPRTPTRRRPPGPRCWAPWAGTRRRSSSSDPRPPKHHEDALNLARMRILFAAAGRGDRSVDEALAALDAAPEAAAAPPDERRYQRLSLAWSITWLRIRAGEAVAHRFRERRSRPRSLPGQPSLPGVPRDPAVRAADRVRRRAADRVGARPGRRPAARLICDNRAINGGGTESKAGGGAPRRHDEVGPAVDRDGPAARSTCWRPLACRI